MGYAALNAYTQQTSASSAEANMLTNIASDLMQFVERSQSLFGRTMDAISQLEIMSEECAEPGWDGEDAVPIDHEALFIARSFIRAMPPDLPMPELAPEPDGSISLDWIRSRNRLFSLSIGKTNRLAYAWLDGTDREHGVASFDGINIPSQILSEISSIIGNNSATFRIA